MIEPRAIVDNGIVPTLCRMCDTRCAVNIHIKDGTIVDVRPYAGHPMNQDRMCPRGAAIVDVFYHPDRLLQPLKKMSDGSFKEISRHQALDEIAEKLLRIRNEYGSRSVGVWKGEGVGFFQQEEYVRRFAHAWGTPNYFSNDSACFLGRYFGHKLVTGFYQPFPEFAEAELIMLFGTNPPMCHPPFMREFGEAIHKKAKLVVIDHRLNPIACAATIFAEPYPGTDGALGWGLIRYLIETDNYDHELVEKYSVGFEKIAEYARRFTPEYVEQQSGIYAQVLMDIAELIIHHRPKISLYIGTGLEHHPNGVNNIRTLAILACLAGTLDLGCGLFWAEPPDINRLTLYHEFDLPGDQSQAIGADKFPLLFNWAREGHTMTAMDYMLGQGEYPLKGLIVTAANPAVTNPNTRKVEKALSSLDLLVVNDFFLTKTARLAHYVLPGATYLERSELHYHRKYHLVTLTPKIMQVPGIEDEYALWHDLAHRLGFGEKFFPWPDEAEVNRYILEPSGLTLEELQKHPGGLVYKPIRYRKHLTRPLPTPSGKVEFASAYLKGLGLPEIPEYRPPTNRPGLDPDYPYILTTGARMSLFFHSRHQNIRRFRAIHPYPIVEICPADAQNLGIKDQDRVRLISPVGQLEVLAKIVHASELLPGIMEMYHGWEECPVNLLSADDDFDPLSGFPPLKAIKVRIEKAAEKTDC